MPFPILKASGLYNSLYYRTSRDREYRVDLDRVQCLPLYLYTETGIKKTTSYRNLIQVTTTYRYNDAIRREYGR